MNSPYDLIGPVLPQALRLARYQASASLPQNVDDLTSENDTINKTPSREEQRLLMSNVNVVSALEDIFSRTEKDRTSRTSKLSRMESFRFQRAIYRIWLMSVLYGPRRFTPRYFSDEDCEDRMSDLDKSWNDQKSFLEQFSSQELVQICRLARFLIFTAGHAVSAEGRDLGGTRYTYDWDGMFLFAGPHIILRCYEDATTTHFPTEYLDDDGPYTEFLMHACFEIIKERHADEPIGYIGTILDDIHDEHVRCRHCGGAGLRGSFGPRSRLLPDLYNETNWGDLKGHLGNEFLVPINLSSNLVEKPLGLALDGNWSNLLHEIFACKCNEYSLEWFKEDWICTNCWSSFFWDTLWRWRLAQKRIAGEPINKDCKYGYSCDKQCHDGGLVHAKKFNHLCKPTEEIDKLGNSVHT